MASSYPGALDSLSNPAAGDATNNVTTPHATQHANANDAIEAIQAELGTDPAGTFTNLKTRLAVTVLNENLNIEGLGAIAGSSSGTVPTDNVSVLVTAVALAGAAGGGDILIPPGTFYLDGTPGADLVTLGASVPGVNIIGVDRNQSILNDLRSSGSTIAIKGTNASSRSKYHRFADFQITGAAGGTNTRKGLDFKWAGHATVERMQFWSTAHAIYGYDWWDSLVNDTRFDQCSTRDGSDLAAVYIQAQSSDTTDCNELKFTNNTWEQCWERDLTLYSNGRDVNKCHFLSNKFECGGSGFLKGNRVYILGGDANTFVDNTFTLGEWYTAYTTAHSAVVAVNTRGTKFIGNRFEGAPVSTGPTVNYMMNFVDFGGTTDSLTVIGNDFQASTNQTGIVGIYYQLSYNGGQVTDYGNQWGYVASGTPLVRSGLPGSLADDLVDIDPMYAYSTFV